MELDLREFKNSFFLGEKNYLNKGYSIQEIRNILNVNDEELPGVDIFDQHSLPTF